jgi:hypothetical protein
VIFRPRPFPRASKRKRESARIRRLEQWPAASTSANTRVADLYAHVRTHPHGCAGIGSACGLSIRAYGYAPHMEKHNGSRRATAAQLWRLNEIGLLELRAEPDLDDRLLGPPVKEVLAAAAMAGLWTPAHGVRGPVRA